MTLTNREKGKDGAQRGGDGRTGKKERTLEGQPHPRRSDILQRLVENGAALNDAWMAAEHCRYQDYQGSSAGCGY
ncbi:MAG: hypothetical protein ACLP59_20825 [Bryobacteraceae bacterium]